MTSKNSDDSFDFRNLNEDHELFLNKSNKKVIGKFKIEAPKNIWIDEKVRLKLIHLKVVIKILINSKVFLYLNRKIIKLRKKMFRWRRKSRRK